MLIMPGPVLVLVPVHPCRLMVENLQPVHADISDFGNGVHCADHGKRNEPAPIGGPALEDGNAGQVNLLPVSTIS